MRRSLIVLALAALLTMLLVSPAAAVSGAAYTTVNTVVDGSGHCKNGSPDINCNMYDGKEFVWLNGGPVANGLGPDGAYFFAVLAPGGQPNPNDGGPKNLSDDYDTYQNRTFTVTNGEVSAYAGTHDKTIPLIRLYPYADTTNKGGVYILAICSLGGGYPVAPRDCKYDAFKAAKGRAAVQTILSGTKYRDDNENGQRDPDELSFPLEIEIAGSDGTFVRVWTGEDGTWSYTTKAHAPGPGVTTYTIQGMIRDGMRQTGNTVDQSLAIGGATVTLADFIYTVTVPNDAVAVVEQLHFGYVASDE